MAKYPDTHNRFPVTPKAYPGTRNAFPVSPKAYPSASTPFNPMTALTNGILWSKMDRDVTTSSASLTSGDPAHASWTKTNCTVVATGTGTQCRLTAGGGTDAYVTATLNGAEAGTTCVPMGATIRAKYESIRYLIFESRNATANNRAVADLQNGVISSLGTGINMQDLTMTDVGGGWYDFYSATWANGGAQQFRIYGSTGTTLTAPALNATMLLDTCSVSQTYVTQVNNFVSGTPFIFAAGARPGYYTNTVFPCIRGFGNQVGYSSEAALTARFVHGAAGPFPSYSLAVLCSFRDAVYSAGSGLYGWGNSGTPVDQSGYLGAFGATAATYAVTARNTGAKNIFSTDTIMNDAFVFGVTYDGTTGTTLIYRNGVAVAAYTGGDGASFNQQNLINVSCGRVAMLGRGAGTATAQHVGDAFEYAKYSNVKTGAEMLTLATGLLTRVA